MDYESLQPTTYHRKGGFTLIELSIILVIIGLIVGGVLLGNDLINAAKLKSQISQFQEYQTSFMTFKSKYDCLPGDCVTASNYNLGANGNGNGVLEGGGVGCFGSLTTPDCYFTSELPLFFIHLSAANLIRESFNGAIQLGVGYPKLAINDNYGMIAAGQWQSGATGTIPNNLTTDYNFPNGIFLFAQMCNGSLNIAGASDPIVANDSCGVMKPSQAYNIDKKIDDGKALSGKIWGYTAVVSCTNSPYTDYNISLNNNVCHISYQLY